MRPYSLAVLVLAIVGVGCAALPKPDSIEASIDQLRAACNALGEDNLDACAERIKAAAFDAANGAQD